MCLRALVRALIDLGLCNVGVVDGARQASALAVSIRAAAALRIDQGRQGEKPHEVDLLIVIKFLRHTTTDWSQCSCHELHFGFAS